VVELEVLRAVERAADSDLDHPSGVDEPFLDGSAKRRPVEVLRAEVFIPRVRMRVEVHQAQSAMAARQRPQNAEGHGVIAAAADRSSINVATWANRGETNASRGPDVLTANLLSSSS